MKKILALTAAIMLMGLGVISCGSSGGGDEAAAKASKGVSDQAIEAVTTDTSGNLDNDTVRDLLKLLEGFGEWNPPIVAPVIAQPVNDCIDLPICSSGSAEACPGDEFHYFDCTLESNGIRYDGTVIKTQRWPLAFYAVDLTVHQNGKSRTYNGDLNYYDLNPPPFITIEQTTTTSGFLNYSVAGFAVTITGDRHDNGDKCTLTTEVDIVEKTFAIISNEDCGINAGFYDTPGGTF